MGTTTNEKISDKTEPTLQLEKPLLPIDEYAAREGISRDLVEECGKLSIIQLRKYKGKTFVIVNDETIETEKLPKSAQDNGTEFDLFAAQAKSKRIWQIAALVSIVLLFATIFGNLWLYMNRKIQTDRLGLAHAEIQKAYNNSIQLKQQIENLQNELSNSRAEVGRLQNELDNSRAEVKTVRNELARVKQNLKTIQERNAKAVEQLNEQIRKLSGQPPN